MTDGAGLPSETEFVDIFQKFKYSFCLLDRLKGEGMEPDSVQLLHHLFVPLDMMVKTTGSSALAASVSSPALTRGAISFLQQNLTPVEKQLWSSLGPNWNQPSSQQDKSVPSYIPVFLDGWKPQHSDENGEPLEDPVKSQNRHEAILERQQSQMAPSQASLPTEDTEESVEEVIPEQMYRCSYDFVARNSSELSVLHGEILQVLDTSKRWWKCRNNYEQIGFVPSNILEPANLTEQDSKVVMRKPSMKIPLSPSGGGRFSYVPSSPSGQSPNHTESRPFSMPPIGGDGEKVQLMNNELAQRLANGRAGSVRPLSNIKTDEAVRVNYHSSPDEVTEWLKAKSFRDNTVTTLGILTGAQLFSLTKEELCKVSPEDGARLFSQILVQKAKLKTEKRATELEAIMQKQKIKVDSKQEEEP